MIRYHSRLFSIIIIILTSILFFTTLKATQSLSVQTPRENCPISFQKFAYEGPRDPSEEKLLPTNPWQIEITSPIKQQNNVLISLDSIAATRIFNGYQEILFTGSLNNTNGINMDQALFIYKPQSLHWEIVRPDIEDTELRAYGFFTTKDGSIWARIERDLGKVNRQRITVPVLARFNNATQRFELVKGMLEAPIVDGYSYLRTSIVEDRNNSLWIFVDNDGLYRYDLKNKIAEKRVDFNFVVYNPSVSADGNIYFSRDPSVRTGFRLIKNNLLWFDPENNQVIPVDTPDEEWPDFSGMLFDHKGQLWLGAIGYQKTDGSWQRIVPNPKEIIQETWAKGFSFAPPTLALESSDGLLWYNKGFDSGMWTAGTAWYDPKTKEGCMISNQPAWPVEDQQHILWMVIDGILYKHSIQS